MERYLVLTLLCVAFLLCSAGSVLGCLQDPRCAEFYSQSQAALQVGNMTAYCLYTSQKLACDTGDTSGCSANVFADIQARENIYFSNCSLTASDVNSCKTAVASCESLLQEAQAFRGREYTSYCAKMSEYVSCVEQNMGTCQPEVTKYDVMGIVYAEYDKSCVSAQYACQLKVTWPCTSSSILAPSGNLTEEELCSLTKNHVDCLNNNFQTCDASVKKSDVPGFQDQEAYYLLSCQAGGLGTCPKIQSCVSMITNALPRRTTIPEQWVNLLDVCTPFAPTFSCISTKLSECSLNTAGRYNFQELADVYTENCPVLASNQDLKNCSSMSTCLASLAQPSPRNLVDIVDRFFKPEFWCSMMKSTLACAKDSSCGSSNGGAFDEAFDRVQELCPNAPFLGEGQGSPGAGHVIRAEWIFVILAAVTATLRV